MGPLSRRRTPGELRPMRTVGSLPPFPLPWGPLKLPIHAGRPLESLDTREARLRTN